MISLATRVNGALIRCLVSDLKVSQNQSRLSVYNVSGGISVSGKEQRTLYNVVPQKITTPFPPTCC